MSKSCQIDTIKVKCVLLEKKKKKIIIQILFDVNLQTNVSLLIETNRSSICLCVIFRTLLTLNLTYWIWSHLYRKLIVFHTQLTQRLSAMREDIIFESNSIEIIKKKKERKKWQSSE